jgi:hypothetical protein
MAPSVGHGTSRCVAALQDVETSTWLDGAERERSVVSDGHDEVIICSEDVLESAETAESSTDVTRHRSDSRPVAVQLLLL